MTWILNRNNFAFHRSQWLAQSNFNETIVYGLFVSEMIASDERKHSMPTMTRCIHSEKIIISSTLMILVEGAYRKECSLFHHIISMWKVCALGFTFVLRGLVDDANLMVLGIVPAAIVPKTIWWDRNGSLGSVVVRPVRAWRSKSQIHQSNIGKIETLLPYRRDGEVGHLSRTTTMVKTLDKEMTNGGITPPGERLETAHCILVIVALVQSWKETPGQKNIRHFRIFCCVVTHRTTTPQQRLNDVVRQWVDDWW